jgi:hypothetical protein
MYTAMGNDECTEMQLKLQNLQDPLVFAITLTVGGTSLNITAGNHAVITQNFWEWNERQSVFVDVVRLEQNRVQHAWLLNTGHRGYNDCASDLHQYSRVARMRLLHSVIS